MKRTTSPVVLVILASVGGVASAQTFVTSSGNLWEGWFAGVNLGGAWNTTCNTWDAQTANAQLNNALNNRDCPNGGVFVGGVQFGYNFQSEHIVWGLGLDWDGASSKNRSRSLTYNGQFGRPPPTGTYNSYGKVEPSRIFLLGPRIAYAFEDWLPYFRAGGVFTSGTNTAALSYTPGGPDPAAGPHTFYGQKNAKNRGWMVEAGVEYEFMDQWSAKLAYNYINLGKSNSSVETCQPAASAACAAFADFSIENTHNSFTASIVRVAVNYRF